MSVKKIWIFVLLMLCTLLISCSTEKVNQYENDSNTHIADYHIDFDLNDKSGLVLQIDSINENLAVAIADAVLAHYCDESLLKETDLIGVASSDDDRAYVVMRQLKECTLGGGYYVAIQKKDGAILKVWMDE